MSDEYKASLESVRTKFYLNNGWKSPIVAEMVGRLEDGEIVSLEDYERIDCYIEDLKKDYAKLLKDNANLLKLLRRVEWCRWDGVDFVSFKCPCCGNYKQQKHMAGCELARELGDA